MGATVTDKPTTYERLSEPFPIEAIKTVKKGGREQTYIPWTDKVERFNEVLGSNWSYRIVREGMTTTEAWALGEITATIDGVETVRQQYGCEPIMRGQREATDLFKIAGTDALSKAATLFGCGLYLSIKEEREAVEAEMRAASRSPKAPATTNAASPGTRANPTAPSASTPSAGGAAPTSSSTTDTSAPSEPTPLKTKAELVADLKKGIEYARGLGIEQQDIDAAAMNRAQIEDVIEAIRRQCRKVLADRKQQAS